MSGKKSAIYMAVFKSSRELHKELLVSDQHQTFCMQTATQDNIKLFSYQEIILSNPLRPLCKYKGN